MSFIYHSAADLTKQDFADPQQGPELHASVALSAENYGQLRHEVKGHA